MTDANRFDRITFDPAIMGGRACIRGLRITAALVVSLVAEGATTDEIVADTPDLEAEDVRHALTCAAWLAREEIIPVWARGIQREPTVLQPLKSSWPDLFRPTTNPLIKNDVAGTAEPPEQVRG